MKLIAFRNAAGQPSLGAQIDASTLADLTAAGLPATLDELLRDPEGLDRARRLLATHPDLPRRPLDGLRYLPPVQNPAKAFAIGLNYTDHAAESNFEPPKHPVIFQRFPSSWVAHDEALQRPRVSTMFDYEAEFVIVIGKPGRYIKREDALTHVAGYSLFNDGSLRDYQFRSNQWLWGKNFDASGSFGPAFVSADELPPGAAGLRLQCRLNGEVLQDANTRDLIFDVSTLVAACSEGMALQPGDLIISGTPAGVGGARKPPIWMKPGDVCEVEVEGLGILRNTIVDEEAAA
ncbi:fumarylacetoacetate hydrolase family protein [Pelomonas sp. KK5]|uniref:fumarylacetoacetate hydrolase family protein n=1 Tax=Pelomonas sp. KK5 TaxID=1855730 RepID=UPI00097CAD12|nr:fumarylacetoacetate hydrolase family protein [Pelomonas sp. KK5]